MFNQPTKSEYPKHAECAAELERTGFYSDAAFTWMAAAQKARHPDNRHWAECRSNYCNQWARRLGDKAA